MKKTTYLFDFDGTLVNSMPTFSSVMLRIINEQKLTVGDDVIKTITPLGYNGSARYFRELGSPLSEEALVAMMNDYAFPDYAERIEAKPEVIATLKALRERGDSLNILTASPHAMLDP